MVTAAEPFDQGEEVTLAGADECHSDGMHVSDEEKHTVDVDTLVNKETTTTSQASVGAKMHKNSGDKDVDKAGAVYARSTERQNARKQLTNGGHDPTSGTATMGMAWKMKRDSKDTLGINRSAIPAGTNTTVENSNREQPVVSVGGSSIGGVDNDHIAPRTIEADFRNEISGFLATAALIDEQAQRRELEEGMLATAREQLMAEAVQASVVVIASDVSEKGTTQRGRQVNKLWCAFALTALVIVTVVIVAVMLTRQNDALQGDDTTSTMNQVGDTPGITNIASPAPSAMIITTFEPSAAPTILPQNVNNDYCSDAINSTLDGTIYDGDLLNSTWDDLVLTYVDEVGSSINPVGGYGRWYFFIGNGLDVTIRNGSLSAIEYLVFTGTCTGETLDNTDTTVVNAYNLWLDGMRYNFETNIGTKYWLLVHAMDSYSLDMSVSMTVSYPYEFSMTSQAYCEGSSALSTLEASSRLLSSGSMAIDLPPCGTATAPVGKGIWFFINGENKSYRLSTEGSTGINTQISIFQGECSNGELQCVAGNDNAINSNDGHSTVFFAGFEGVRYSILVHGASIEVIGEFTLSLEEYPINDIPSGALDVALTINTILSVQGSTANFTAEVYEPFSSCKPIQYESPASLWYRISGTGSDITLSVESSSTSVESGSERNICVNVFSQNALGDYECIPATVDDCTSLLSFFAEATEPYLVMVGDTGALGGFNLTISA